MIIKFITISLIILKVTIVNASPMTTKIKSTLSNDAIKFSLIKFQQRQQLDDGVKLRSITGSLNYCDGPICYPKSDLNSEDLGCFDPWPLTVYDTFDLYKLCPQSPSIIEPKFMVYTVDQPEIPIQMRLSSVQSMKIIHPMDKIVFFVHGYKNSFNDSRFIAIKDELLTIVDVVILVDYSIGADPKVISRVTDFYNFHQAAVNTQVIGRQVAIFVQKMQINRDIDYDNVHLICFSMGSAVGHFMGHYSVNKLGFQVGRITALDPPGILIFGPGKRLSQSDAQFVDVIHTTSFKAPWDFNKAGSGKVGNIQPLGHIDFYPNGGGENNIDQPGCSGIDWCSHSFSLELLKASIQKCDFLASTCSSYTVFSSGQCKTNPKDSKLGFWSFRYPGRGRYYLSTSNDPASTC